MPSTERGRKLTPDEQAAAEAEIKAAPKDVWLSTGRPLHPEAPRKRAGRARGQASPTTAAVDR